MSAAVALASDLKFSPLLKTKRQHFWMSRPIWRQVIHTHIHKHTNTHDLYGSGGKIIFWSHMGEESPEKPQNLHRTPCRGRIESIKSAGKKSQKVTLITWPRHFIETLISCWIYVPKNAILQVNSEGTSLEILLILTFCYLCRLLIPRSSWCSELLWLEASLCLDQGDW